MYGGVNVQKMHDQFELCMETTNLNLNDKRRTSDQVQIDQQSRLINSTIAAPVAQPLQGGSLQSGDHPLSLSNGSFPNNPQNSLQNNLQNNPPNSLQNNLQNNLPYPQTTNYLADYNFNELNSTNLNGDINANLATNNTNCNLNANPNGQPNGNPNGNPNLMNGNINTNLNSASIHPNNTCSIGVNNGDMNSNPTLTNGSLIDNGDLNADSYSPTPVFINLDQQQPAPFLAKQIKQEIVQNDSYPDAMNMSQYPDKEFSQTNRDAHSPVSDANLQAANRNLSSVSKICRVCGDKSLGYNFSQVTCESCKVSVCSSFASSFDTQEKLGITVILDLTELFDLLLAFFLFTFMWVSHMNVSHCPLDNIQQ